MLGLIVDRWLGESWQNVGMVGSTLCQRQCDVEMIGWTNVGPTSILTSE